MLLMNVFTVAAVNQTSFMATLHSLRPPVHHSPARQSVILIAPGPGLGRVERAGRNATMMALGNQVTVSGNVNLFQGVWLTPGDCCKAH